jgi:hypothetical protein
VDIATLTDEQIDGLKDAVFAETSRREHLVGNPALAKSLQAMSQTELDVLYHRLYTEEADRDRKTLLTQVAHELEQGAARKADGKTDEDRHRVLTYRCARLFKMAYLRAPTQALVENVDLVRIAVDDIAANDRVDLVEHDSNGQA